MTGPTFPVNIATVKYLQFLKCTNNIFKQERSVFSQMHLFVTEHVPTNPCFTIQPFDRQATSGKAKKFQNLDKI